MGQYRKKPVVIEAFQLGSVELQDAIGWQPPDWLREAIVAGTVVPFDQPHRSDWMFLRIKTLEGDMVAEPGDWVIKGVKGELYPCKADIFAATYDPVEPGALEWAAPPRAGAGIAR